LAQPIAPERKLLAVELGAEDRALADAPLQALDDQPRQVLQYVGEVSGVAAPETFDARQAQVLAEKMPGQGRQIGGERRVFQHAAADGVDHAHLAAARGFHQAWHAEHGVRAQFQWVAPGVVDAPPEHVDRPQAVECPPLQTSTAHQQIGALDQLQAERFGQQRLLEVRLVARARRQQRERRIAARCGRRGRREIGPQGAQERLVAMRLRLPVKAGQHARGNAAVLERIAQTGGHLRAVRQHPGAPVAIAHQIGGVQRQLVRERQADVLAGAQEAAMPEYQRRRQQAPAQHLARAVEVAQQQVQQLGTLREAGLDGGPLFASNHQRRHVERPGLALAVDAVDVVAGAGLVQQAACLAGAAGQCRRAQRAQRLRQPLPVRLRVGAAGYRWRVLGRRRRVVLSVHDMNCRRQAGRQRKSSVCG
jgi:hypothetical protein